MYWSKVGLRLLRRNAALSDESGLKEKGQNCYNRNIWGNMEWGSVFLFMQRAAFLWNNLKDALNNILVWVCYT